MWWDESIWSETFNCSPAGFTAFAACLIFTLHRKDILNDTRDLRKGHFGYCFVLAWICVPLLLISAFLYAHLRKRQWEQSSRPAPFSSQWPSFGRLRMNEWLWKSHSSVYFQTLPNVQQSEDWRRTFRPHCGISVCGALLFCPVVIILPRSRAKQSYFSPDIYWFNVLHWQCCRYTCSIIHPCIQTQCFA